MAISCHAAATERARYHNGKNECVNFWYLRQITRNVRFHFRFNVSHSRCIAAAAAFLLYLMLFWPTLDCCCSIQFFWWSALKWGNYWVYQSLARWWWWCFPVSSSWARIKYLMYWPLHLFSPLFGLGSVFFGEAAARIFNFILDRHSLPRTAEWIWILFIIGNCRPPALCLRHRFCSLQC